MSENTYMSLHGILVQLQVLFGGSLLHELGAELIDLVSAPGHPVCHHLHTAFLLLQLQLHPLQLVLMETTQYQFYWVLRWMGRSNVSGFRFLSFYFAQKPIKSQGHTTHVYHLSIFTQLMVHKQATNIDEIRYLRYYFLNGFCYCTFDIDFCPVHGAYKFDFQFACCENKHAEAVSSLCRM